MLEVLNIKSLTSESLAKILSAAYRQHISKELVEEIANQGDLFTNEKTINILEFTAYLLKGDKNDT